MRREIMNILACPQCKSRLNLTVREERDERIITGSLQCLKCPETYPIRNAIPNLLPPHLRTL